jgi:hypothetical protein
MEPKHGLPTHNKQIFSLFLLTQIQAKDIVYVPFKLLINNFSRDVVHLNLCLKIRELQHLLLREELLVSRLGRRKINWVFVRVQQMKFILKIVLYQNQTFLERWNITLNLLPHLLFSFSFSFSLVLNVVWKINFNENLNECAFEWRLERVIKLQLRVWTREGLELEHKCLVLLK